MDNKIKKILIVCTGNSCRSPMAEGFLKRYLKAKEDLEIISAGTFAVSGFSPTQEALEVMKEDEIDISSYTTRSLSEELVKSADIVLVMTDDHKRFMLERFPGAKDKVYLYKEFAGIDDADKEIHDPIGQPISTYRDVKEQIKKASIGIAKRIEGA